MKMLQRSLRARDTGCDALRLVMFAGGLLSGLLNGEARADGLPEPVEDPWRELPDPIQLLAPATELHLGRYAVQIEHTTLYDIQKTLNAPTAPNPILHKENDDESIDWLCFDLASGQRLWFIADTNPDADSIKFAVTRIAGEQPDASEPVTACPALPKGLDVANLDRGIWLGAKATDLIALYGPPSAQKGDWLSFYYTRRVLQRRRTPDADGQMLDDFDISSYLNVKVVDGRVVQLVAGKLTSE